VVTIQRYHTKTFRKNIS